MQKYNYYFFYKSGIVSKLNRLKKKSKRVGEDNQHTFSTRRKGGDSQRNFQGQPNKTNVLKYQWSWRRVCNVYFFKYINNFIVHNFNSFQHTGTCHTRFVIAIFLQVAENLWHSTEMFDSNVHAASIAHYKTATTRYSIRVNYIIVINS